MLVSHPIGKTAFGNSKRNFHFLAIGAPDWVPRVSGMLADSYVDFVNNRAWNGNRIMTAVEAVTVSRTTTGYRDDAAGNWSSFGTGILRRTDKGAKIEDTRINLLLQSQDFATTWAALGGGTVSTNTQVAPDGTTTGDTITAAGAASGVTQNITISGTAANRVAASVFAKPGNVNFVVLRFVYNGVTYRAWFNASTGAVGTIEAASGNLTTFVSAMTPYVGANGWYRFGLILTTTTTTTLSVSLHPAAADNTDSANGNTINVWQAQAEVSVAPPTVSTAGSVSSIIPTTTATVARNADAVTLTNPPTITVDTVTSYIKLVPDTPDNFALSPTNLQIDDGSASNRYTMFRTGAATPTARQSGATTGTGSIPTIATTGVFAQQVVGKSASVFASADRAQSLNGGTISSNAVAYTLGVIPSVWRIGINSAGTLALNGDVLEVAFWANLRAPNSELQRITT